MARRPASRNDHSPPGESRSSPDRDGLKKNSTCLKKLSKLYSCLQPFPAPLFISASHQLMWETARGSSMNMCVSGEGRSGKPFLNFKDLKKKKKKRLSEPFSMSSRVVTSSEKQNKSSEIAHRPSSEWLGSLKFPSRSSWIGLFFFSFFFDGLQSSGMAAAICWFCCSAKF